MDLVSAVHTATNESREQLQKYLTWVQSALDEPEKHMLEAIENHKNFSNELRFYILEQRHSQVVGTIGLIIRDAEVPFFEIGYWIRSSQTGKGYITEAVQLLESYAFNKLQANRLEIRMAKCNSKSKAVAERTGYLFEAKLKNERRLPTGELSDTLVYRKLEL